MLIKDINNCKEIIANDGSFLKEILSPFREKVDIGYSIALARVKTATRKHKLRSAEIYFILRGKGIMYIDDEKAIVREGQIIYIPPNSIQKIENIGDDDLVFLCIVEPAWKEEDEEILE